ncbi:MAG: hypothetical protein J6Z49_10645 [Kiritimatiellae bacterium]|nr:hypothetical protein [Kiritimatiellia bacterium]
MKTGKAKSAAKTTAFGALAIAFAFAQSAHAAYVAWYGGGSSPFYWDDTSNWRYNSGSQSNPKWATPSSVPTGNYWNIDESVLNKLNSSKFASGWNPKIITFRTVGTFGSALNFSAGSESQPIVFTTEDDAHGISKPGYLLNIKGGGLHIQRGTYKSNLTVDGHLRLGDGNHFVSYETGAVSGSGTLVFDSATLKATSVAASLTVNVGAAGATFDTAGGTLTINAALNDKSGEAGNVLLTGGGSVALVGAAEYTGKTSVMPGTVLDVSHDNAAAILSHGLELVGIPALDTPITVLTSAEDLSDLDLSGVACPAAATFTAAFGADGKSIVVTCTAHAPGWYVGPADGDLSVGANWTGGAVPNGIPAVFFCTTPASLTVPEGVTLSPSSIVFQRYCASVSIGGDGAFSGVSKVENNSASTMELATPVSFATNIDVVQNPGAVKFSGGATGVKLARATNIHGLYTLTVSGDHTEIANTTVKSDGEYRLPNGCFYKHNADFNVDAGGKAVVKSAKIDHNNKDGKRLLDNLSGTFIVEGEFQVKGGNNRPTHYLANGGNGVLVVGGIRISNGAYFVPYTSGGIKAVIGSGGIVRGVGYIRVYNSGSMEIGSSADWTMRYEDYGHTDTANPAIYKHNSTTTSTLTFDTSDYYDPSVGRTITCEAPIAAENANSANAFKVNVKGCGGFVFANTSDGNIFAGGLTVQDSATVSVMPSARPGKGAVTLQGTSTLKLAQSGTVTLGGNLSLAEGTTLAFNYTDNATAPVLDVTDKTVTASGTIAVKVSAADGVKPGGSATVLTQGGAFAGKDVALAAGAPEWAKGVSVNNDGNIVLKLMRKSTVIIVR